MTLTNKDIEEAAKFTTEELITINNTVDRLADRELRPLVWMALASHIIGTVIRGSEGTLSKELVMDLVSKGVEV